MIVPAPRRAYGPILQNGYVVDDLDAAMDHWIRVVGVGPFHVLEHIAFAETWFRGARSAIDLTVAIACWGEVQIELIVQHNDAASIYREFRDTGGTGLQHVGALTDSLDKALADFAAHGVAPVQWGSTAGGMRFAYVGSDFHPGGMIELIERGPAVDAFFAAVRDSARDWDGTRPIRGRAKPAG
jgi:hypothetical protein